ncbi:MAG: acyl-CoA dehydrogenase family protein [Thermoplasmatota archaeon]
MTADNEVLDAFRQNVREFVEREVEPIARELDRERQLIPPELITKLGDQGYHGILFPEEHGGLGLDNQTMVVVAEELSRGWLSVGSVMTRNIITGTILLHHGTDDQKARWLPGLATARTLSAAAFTEPSVGSDLGSVETAAKRNDAGDGWQLHGEKTWCTMGLQASVLTVLCRTDPDTSLRHRGLSLLLAEKPADAWPEPTMTGGPIPSIGYRGMKSYSVFFDGHDVPDQNVVGMETGKGFKQLMSTFEVARIQTAARAVGVGQAALDAAVAYATQRRQFGKTLAEQPVIRHKLAEMAARLEAARRLTYYAAEQKDTGKRCDLEAGMAKMVATEMVEYVAREGLQIHGAYGYSEEFDAQRFWRDSKVFSVFEGTSEIQADVVAKQLLGRYA